MLFVLVCTNTILFYLNISWRSLPFGKLVCLLHELGQAVKNTSVISNFLEPKEEYAWILFLAICQPAC